MTNIIDQVKEKLKLFLTSVEQKLRIKREQIIYHVFGSIIIYLIFSSDRDFICNSIGFIFPVYASLLTIGSPVRTNEPKWSIYWIVYALLGFFEYFHFNFYLTPRFYWVGKFILLSWFMSSGLTGGTNLIYYGLIRRFLRIHSQKKQNFYNIVSGECSINNANLYDQHGNPSNREYDLGRDGAFTEYHILIGQFYTSGDMKQPIEALEMKGFHVDNVKDEIEFLSKLQTNHYQIVWVISASAILNSEFIPTLLDFHSSGGSIFLFADNIPYISHASKFLEKKFGISLTGNYQGNKTLTFKEDGYSKAGRFGQHEIFTGIKNLFEGVTICHPVYSIPISRKEMITVATATDGQPCIAIFDPPAESGEGRLCLDCGFTKLFINWNSAGTARFIVNASCWLAKGKNDIGFGG